jgi:hypothetical protein
MHSQDMPRKTYEYEWKTYRWIIGKVKTTISIIMYIVLENKQGEIHYDNRLWKYPQAVTKSWPTHFFTQPVLKWNRQ